MHFTSGKDSGGVLGDFCLLVLVVLVLFFFTLDVLTGGNSQCNFSKTSVIVAWGMHAMMGGKL